MRDSLIDERTSAVSDAAAYLADVLASDDDGSRVPVVIGAIRHRFPDLPALGPLLETTEQRYALIGETAPPLRADEWLGDSLPIAGRGGKVRVLEFTAHWCAACHLSYPTLVAIARRHASDVDVVLATQTYGYFGRDTAVAFDDEVARDRMLYARELPIRSGIAVERRPAGAGDDWQGANARAYGVKALPVLVVTDRSGIVRDIWFGWTEASAARLQRDVTRAMGTSVSSQ